VSNNQRGLPASHGPATLDPPVDGSLPLPYGSYPPPGAPGGGPSESLGWGPGAGLGEPRRRTGLLAAVLVGACALGGLGLAVLAVAVTTREDGAVTTTPAPAPYDAPADADATTAKFYLTGAQQPAGCRESAAGLAGPAEAAAYYSTVKLCLDKAWQRQVGESGATFRAPRLVTWARVVQSPCSGGALPSSFYCPASSSVYLKYDDDVTQWRKHADARNRAYTRIWATNTVAHQYGHHLQQLSGILPAVHALEYEATSADARLELRRRTELQASCLGAVFLGANQTTYPVTGQSLQLYREYVMTTGDELNPAKIRDHGSRSSHQLWMNQGFTTANNASCNTFEAPPSKVS
jgi:uncharacterized protein